jgi:threonylcarbamoyladenosine tRNA methylthiotransferase MtaB
MAEYEKLVLTLKSNLPNCAIGADVIAGFPGETKINFERTQAFIEKTPIDYLHVFPYSQRELASAAKLKGAVPAAEKHRRADILRAISEEKRFKFYKNNVGKKLDVVIERRRDKNSGSLKGVSENYIPVLINGKDDLMGKTAQVEIIDVNKQYAKGEL